MDQDFKKTIRTCNGQAHKHSKEWGKDICPICKNTSVREVFEVKHGPHMASVNNMVDAVSADYTYRTRGFVSQAEWRYI